MKLMTVISRNFLAEYESLSEEYEIMRQHIARLIRERQVCIALLERFSANNAQTREATDLLVELNK